MAKPVDEKEAVKLLFAVKDALDKLNIRFWLRDGTLLGAIRDKRIIPWDDDVDIGIESGKINKKSIRKKFSRILENKGYLTQFLSGHLIIKRDEKAVLNADIFPSYHPEKTMYLKQISPKNKLGHHLNKLNTLLQIDYYCSLSKTMKINKKYLLPKLSNLMIPEKIRGKMSSFLIWSMVKINLIKQTKSSRGRLTYLKDFRKIKFYDRDFLIVAEAEKFLEEMYGDWKTPVNYEENSPESQS